MKKLVSVLFIVILFISNCVVSNASDEIELSLVSNYQIVDKDSNITITLKADEIKLEDTLTYLEGKLEYDKDIFELISFKGVDIWNVTYLKDKGKFSILLSQYDDKFKSGDIAKIELKVKKSYKDKETKIAINNIIAVVGDMELENDEISCDIKINENIGLAESQKNNLETNKNNSENKQESINNNSLQNNKKDINGDNNNQNDNKIKKDQTNPANVGINIAIVILIISAIAMAVMVVVKITKSKNK